MTWLWDFATMIRHTKHAILDAFLICISQLTFVPLNVSHHAVQDVAAVRAHLVQDSGCSVRYS